MLDYIFVKKQIMSAKINAKYLIAKVFAVIYFSTLDHIGAENDIFAQNNAIIVQRSVLLSLLVLTLSICVITSFVLKRVVYVSGYALKGTNILIWIK